MTTPERPDGDASVTDSRREDLPTAFVSEGPLSQAEPPPWTREESAPPASATAGEPLGGLVMVAGVVAIVGAGQWLAFDLDRAGGVSFWAWAIGPTALVAVYALVRAHRDGDLEQLVRPAWGDTTRGILSAAMLVAAAIAFVHVVAPAGSARESWTARLYLQLGDPRWLRGHASLVTALVVTAAAAEELVWRGLVPSLLAERVGSRTAWAWAAVAYALAQLPTLVALRDPEAGLNPLLVLAALGLGLVWGGMARFSRRIAPSVLSHAAFDLAVILLFRLWGSGI
jgi:membrane protease YdiL (CAAX protease family)